MSVEKINESGRGKEQNNLSLQQEIGAFRGKINTLLDTPQKIITQKLKELEKTEKGFCVNEGTLNSFFQKYPHISVEEFRGFFFQGTYNKNIFMCSPEIIEHIDLNEIQSGDDIIAYLIQQISISQDEFNEKVIGKIDVLTFPNLARSDIAQGYFYNKLEGLLKETKIIFGDMPEIRQNIGRNQFNCDSVGFIDLMGNGLFNTCLLKLLKTSPSEEKLNELNNLFSSVEKDIFIGGSTFHIPFELPKTFQPVSLPKMPVTTKDIKLLPNGVLINSMGYLNSAYYAEKTKGSFVIGSHNIAEPLHAGKLTVINNDPTNRFNHNWLVSYFGEKCDLLLYMEGTQAENQEKINTFLDIPEEELQERYKKFQALYHSQIQPLIFGILYNFLKKNIPEHIK